MNIKSQKETKNYFKRTKLQDQKKITPEKYKFSTTSLRSKAEMTEDSIAELENISVDFTQYEQQR